jgi:hypothetical protein
MAEAVNKGENQLDDTTLTEKTEYNIPDGIVFEFVDDEGEDEQRSE